MKLRAHLLFVLAAVHLCCSNKFTKSVPADRTDADDFKVIGYYYYVPSGPAAADLDIAGLTHINYSFALPEKEAFGLEPIQHPDNLRKMVEIAHSAGKQVFVSLGGWNIGDGGGNDSRFHRIASTAAGRKAFVHDVMALVDSFRLDGVDMDWEYPDADSSADHFVAIMQDLKTVLHQQGKKLSTAVVSYDGRLASTGKIASAFGIKKEIFEIADWINIMAYDDENGKPFPNPHSTYELAEKCLNYWIDERGLVPNKAVLGLPFYAKPGYISYKALLDQGADPTKDAFNKVFYNGTETIKAKTRLALNRNCGGVMIWEISQDVKGKNSLIGAIAEEVKR
jgi:chitinase